MYFDQIDSADYRKVLVAIAEKGSPFLSKGEIASLTQLKRSTLSNALNLMKSRGILLAQKGVSGMYRLPTKSFALWINLYGRAREQQIKSGDWSFSDLFNGTVSIERH